MSRVVDLDVVDRHVSVTARRLANLQAAIELGDRDGAMFAFDQVARSVAKLRREARAHAREEAVR